MLPYVKVYRDFIDIVRELDNGARGRLFLAIMQYANEEEVDNLTGAEKIAFMMVKSQIDRDRDAYAETSAKRKEAGKAGAKRRWEQENMANAILPMANDSKNSKCHKDKDKEEDKEKEKENIKETTPNGVEKKTSRFSPPTLEEVKAYCTERHNGVDAERWFNYYSANGWMVGKNHMKDWKAAVRTWEKETAPEKPASKNSWVRQYVR